MKKIILTSFITALIIVAGFYVFKNTEKAIAGLSGSLVNIVGSRPATTTIAAFFNGNGKSGTSSQVVSLKGFADLAITSFKITGASSTPTGILTYQFLGSNDRQCDTATTTTTANDQALASEINWYSLGTEGQISSTGAVATGTVVTLQNLVLDCLRVEINGSSTSALVQTRTKDLQ